jgi:hypothetical protein
MRTPFVVFNLNAVAIVLPYNTLITWQKYTPEIHGLDTKTPKNKLCGENGRLI